MFLTIGEHRINVVAFGPGPRTFVGVGGWAGSWELWQQPFEELSRTWRTVSYDHRGTGETVVPPEAITLDGMVSDLFGIMDALGIDRCVLGAESSGARTALTAALEHPDRFAGLVLVDGNIKADPPAGENAFATALRADFEAAIDGFMQRCTPGEENAHLRRWGRDILRRAGSEAGARLAESGAGFAIEDRLGAITIPMLIIHSARDRIVPLASSEALAARLPNCALIVLDSDCHVPTVTHAAEVAAAIEAHFGTPPGVLS